MILTKSLCWLFLMLVNVPLLVIAAVSSFLVSLFNMPYNIWENVNEFFDDQ